MGGKLFYKANAGEKDMKINSRWQHGIFAGVTQARGELWIAIKDKVFAIRSVRRIRAEERL